MISLVVADFMAEKEIENDNKQPVALISYIIDKVFILRQFLLIVLAY
jgi:hypothetical protein